MSSDANKFWKTYFLLLVCLKWTRSYVVSSFKRMPKPLHIFFCTVDHFEPGTGFVPTHIERERVDRLLTAYPKVTYNHKDSGGNLPKRTWFFPPHYHRNDSLRRLVSLCEMGYGEIELHLHHGKTRADTSENLRKTIEQCIEEYGYFGIFGSENGAKRYGFIHGDWALNNSRDGKFCGVNDEIEILKETGCYADFTFPSMIESNPKQMNLIYYANGDQKRPKSYNRGCPVTKLCGKTGDLMIIQGPLYPFFLDGKIKGLRCVGDAINGRPPVTSNRIDFWVKTGIHIKGQRNWIIIKTHTHGATDADAVLGREMDEIYSYLEKEYDDGENYILHYVTAREMYNIIKAIEAGEFGKDPEAYRNYKIKPPRFDSSPRISEASKELKELIAKTYSD